MIRQTEGTHLRSTNDRRRWGSAVPDMDPYPGASRKLAALADGLLCRETENTQRNWNGYFARYTSNMNVLNGAAVIVHHGN